MKVVYPGPNVLGNVRRETFQSMRHPEVVIEPSLDGQPEKETEVPDDIAAMLLEGGTVRLPAAEQKALDAAEKKAEPPAQAPAHQVEVALHVPADDSKTKKDTKGR